MDKSQQHWDDFDRWVERELSHVHAQEIRRLRDIDAAKAALADAVEPELDAATIAYLKSYGAVTALVLAEIAECNRQDRGDAA